MTGVAGHLSLNVLPHASTFQFSFTGPGVSGAVQLTYGLATDAKYPDAFEVTGISGTFSDSNNGLDIVDVPIGPLVPITHDTPEPDNLLAPNDFSRFAVASGLAPQNNGVLTYDKPLLSRRFTANRLRLPASWRNPRHLRID